MTNSNDALRACPFCGGSAVMRRDDDPGYPWYVTFEHEPDCTMYALPTDMFRSFSTEAEAIAAWNRRPSPVAGGDLREAGQTLLDRLVDHEVRMSSEDDAREWFGHVTPAISRFRAALNQPAAPVEAVEAVEPVALIEWVTELARRDIAREQTDFIGRMHQAMGEFESICYDHPNGDFDEAARDDAGEALAALTGLALAQLAMVSNPSDPLSQIAHPPEPAASTVAQGEG